MVLFVLIKLKDMLGGKNINLNELNRFISNSLSGHLGMEVTEIGSNSLTMKMPVDDRTKQPMGILNGGASLALAESVASLAGNLSAPEGKACVGLEINGNHLKAVRSGYVHAKASPIHLGGRTQVWQIDITNDHSDLICICRMTLAVIEKP
ncbi:MAG: 1,4-dihydroxy-2-naphthoyl-CoA hydrolase [Bacteroidia bacterium]|jgi:1,4-dihydroxy-2-naphthoyl-CoA hydrolase